MGRCRELISGSEGRPVGGCRLARYSCIRGTTRLVKLMRSIGLEARFTELDVDRDGRLSRADIGCAWESSTVETATGTSSICVGVDVVVLGMALSSWPMRGSCRWSRRRLLDEGSGRSWPWSTQRRYRQRPHCSSLSEYLWSSLVQHNADWLGAMMGLAILLLITKRSSGASLRLYVSPLKTTSPLQMVRLLSYRSKWSPSSRVDHDHHALGCCAVRTAPADQQ